MAKSAAAAGPVDAPWALPDGWRWDRLRMIGRWGSGGTPKAKTPDYYGGGIPWYKIGDLTDGVLRGSADTISQAGLDASSAKWVPSGALLIAMYGSIGKLGLNIEPVTTNQAIAFCVPDGRTVRLRYLFYFLLFRRPHLLSLGQGGTQQNISQTILLEEPIPFPELDVQERIVARIDELFAEIDDGEAALARARDDLATWRKALLKAAVTGELTANWRDANLPTETGADLLARILGDRRARWEAEPKNRGKRYRDPDDPDLEDMPNIPESWTWATAEALTSGGRNDIVIGPFGSDLKTTDYHDEGVPLIFVRHIRAMNFSGLRPQFVSVSKAAQLDSHVARSGDVLITKMGDPPGDAAVYPQGLADGIVTADCIRWRPCSGLPARFLVEWINSQAGRRWITSKTKGVAQQKITLALFRSMPVPVPPAAEVEAVLGELGRLRHLVADLSEAEADAAATSPTLRQSILAAAFRGELA